MNESESRMCLLAGGFIKVLKATEVRIKRVTFLKTDPELSLVIDEIN